MDWHNLSLNINAIPLLEKNMDEIDGYESDDPMSSSNRCWENLSCNINAISLLEKNFIK